MNTIPLATPEFRKRTIMTGEKQRVVYEPNDEARRGNEALIQQLREGMLDYRTSTGGGRGQSLTGNILPHWHNRHFYMLDIHDAFPSVHPGRLARTLHEREIFPNAATAYSYLEAYCIDPETGGLRLGAPASPELFNAYCVGLDDQLRKFCNERGLTCTRYLDDITVSAPAHETFGKKRRRKIRDFIEGYGFTVAHHKTRLHSLDNGPVTITGLSLYPDGHYQLSRELVQRVKDGFDEIEALLEQQHGYLTPQQEGRLHGLHGVVISSHDIRLKEYTSVEIMLVEQYKKLRDTVKNKRRQLGRPAAQKTLFSPHAYKLNRKGLNALIDEWETRRHAPRGPRAPRHESPTLFDEQKKPE